MQSLENRKQVIEKQYKMFIQEKQKCLQQQNDIEIKIKQLRNKRTQLLQTLDELENTAVREITNVEDLVRYTLSNVSIRLEYKSFRIQKLLIM